MDGTKTYSRSKYFTTTDTHIRAFIQINFRKNNYMYVDARLKMNPNL